MIYDNNITSEDKTQHISQENKGVGRKMRKTQSESFNTTVLEKRITVSDKELAFMLGVGLVTARKVAADANAVCRIGNRKVNKVDKVREYMDSIAGE